MHERVPGNSIVIFNITVIDFNAPDENDRLKKITSNYDRCKKIQNDQIIGINFERTHENGTVTEKKTNHTAFTTDLDFIDYFLSKDEVSLLYHS